MVVLSVNVWHLVILTPLSMFFFKPETSDRT